MKRFIQYQTDRLSAIPNMASAISKKISEFQYDYRKMLEEASLFFEKHYEYEAELTQLNKKIVAYQEHIDIVENYRKEKGKYPLIKGQRSAQRYLEKLHQKIDEAELRIKQIAAERLKARGERYISLEKLIDNILDLLDGPKIFSQFLGTMVLSTPLPNETVRCTRNEKNKPIYITALTVALFEEARLFNQFTSPYLKQALSDIIGYDKVSLMQRHDYKPFTKEQKMAYREEVLKPIVKATLLRHIGSYAPHAEAIYQGNRFRLLDAEQRNKLLAGIKRNSYLYLRQGVGLPQRRFDKKEERDEFFEIENAKLDFMTQLLDFDNQEPELRDLMRIPMVYASFMLSTKEEYDYRNMYRAYDILKGGMKQGEYNANFCALFLRMVGRFPLGSGVYFISHETEQIEKGIVSSLFPKNPEEPYVKQITRNHIQSLSQTEVLVVRSTNIYFESTRDNSGLEEVVFTQRYQPPYVWNANEVWEVQVPALVFWKKDGTTKNSNLALL
ncbi:hypothetical protein [Pseudoalteromonas sp. MMG024]|uniref:hypothetical protein n=1 Tax=Pseudoalteromonas sp. MMG024 TaxID=2909980 RepID=UPI001F161C0D|nr:hypothetical protein [Pseudoalteromonas sp. MMG024]MCF6458938.1 hypothetical protein [Pseudoalteromonas sp. MMG024]